MFVSSQKIRRAMIAANFNIKKLAQIAEIPPFSVSKMTRQDRNIHLSTLSRLSRALRVDSEDLLVDV